MTTRYLSIVMRAMLWFMWFAHGLAAAAVAAVTSASDLETLNVPLVIVGINLLFSTLVGGTTLAIRINAQLLKDPDKPLPRPWLFCAAHMGGAWIAGILAFVWGQHQHVGIWFGFGMVLTGSFMGSRLFEVLTEKYFPMRPAA